VNGYGQTTAMDGERPEAKDLHRAKRMDR